MIKQALSVVVTLGLLAAACGSDSDGGAGGGGLTLSDLPGEVAAAQCQAYENCVGSQLFDLFLGGTDCVAQTTQSVLAGEFAQYADAVAAGRMTYDASKARACLDEIAARTCSTLYLRETATCRAAIDGTVELGGSCSLDGECQGVAYCKSESRTCPGACTALGAAGDTCEDDDECSDGLICSEAGTCATPGAVGATCGLAGMTDCSAGLVCAGADEQSATPGNCAKPSLTAALGEACSIGSTWTLCASGLSCAVKETTPALAFECVTTGSYAAGGPCKIAVPDACPAGQLCDVTGTGVDGTCKVAPAAGEPCASSPITECADGLTCVAGTCVAKATNGVACTADEACYSKRCVAGLCAADVPCR